MATRDVILKWKVQVYTWDINLCKISTVIGSSAPLGEVKYPHTERFAPWKVKYGI